MQIIIKGGRSQSDSGLERDMHIQDLFSTRTNQDKLREEKVIISAVSKYFETSPSRLKSVKEDTESLIISAFHRYFVKK
jgi:hypothetical protein